MIAEEAIYHGEGWTWTRNNREVIHVTGVHASPVDPDLLYCTGGVGRCMARDLYQTRHEALDALCVYLEGAIKTARVGATMMERVLRRLNKEKVSI